MKTDIKDFANKVREFTVSTDNKTLKGTIETTPQQFSGFEIKGVIAKKIHRQILAIENVGSENKPWSDF